MRRVLDAIDRYQLLVAVGTTVLWGAILVVRVFLPHPVGLGDQDDGHRLFCELGLRDDRPWQAPGNELVYPTWVEHRYYGETCGANGTGEAYYSSHLALLRLARMLTPVLGLPGALDLRALAVICIAIVAFALGWLVAVLPGRVALRFVVVSAIGLLFADPGVAGYFISPYSEPAALLSVLLLCPALLMFFRADRPQWHHYLLVASIAAFAIASKTQMISLLPVIVVALLWNRRAAGAHRAQRLTRGFAVMLALGLAAVSGLYFTSQPQRFTMVNAYNQVFGTILPTSPDPAGDLEWFGLDPALASGSGTHILSEDSVATDPAYAEFTEKVTPAEIALFYLTHPARLPGLVGTGMEGAAEFRLPDDYAGSNLAGSGLPATQIDHRMESYTFAFTAFEVAPAVLLGGYWLVALIVFLTVTYHRADEPGVQAVGKLGLALIAAAFIQFWAVMLSDGRSDLVKHMIVVNVCTALTMPLLLAAWLNRKRRGTEGEEQQERTGGEADREPVAASVPAAASV